MALKNFNKIKLLKNEKTYWKLYDNNGYEIIPFTEWTIFIQDRFAFQTRDKYSQVVSKFLDYLVEVNIFEKTVSKMEFKNAIENYKILLSRGKNVTDTKLKLIAEELNFNEISPASWSNNISAINSFLNYIFSIEEDHREYILLNKNIKLSDDFNNILPELNSITVLNSFEKKALSQRSFIANLYRKTGEIKISTGLKANNYNKNNIELDNLDFPALEIPKLLLNTSCSRDKAIYALLIGTGIRSSEAISLTWDMIDIEKQEVYIVDTNKNRNNENLKFKGRNTIKTFFIPELRHIFFQALYEYQLKESNHSVNHNYVFQFLKGKDHGNPYYTVSRQGFIKEFKKTVKRAGITNPNFLNNNFWTPHSLRHFYGVYMLNHIPLKDKFGFSIEEVQKMMGHKSIEVTKKYARRPDEYIKEQLSYAEMRIEGKNIDLKEFNLLFSNKMLENI